MEQKNIKKTIWTKNVCERHNHTIMMHAMSSSHRETGYPGRIAAPRNLRKCAIINFAYFLYNP